MQHIVSFLEKRFGSEQKIIACYSDMVKFWNPNGKCGRYEYISQESDGSYKYIMGGAKYFTCVSDSKTLDGLFRDQWVIDRRKEHYSYCVQY